MTQSRMLDPSDSHPSPPSVFAISCTSHLLLSTSTSPPTIYLRNLGQSMSPILLRPRCSSSAVTAANFHPEAANIFLLAFADGSAAVYDASLITRDTGTNGRTQRSANADNDGEIGFIKGLHAICSRTRKHPGEDGEWATDPNETSIQAEARSITAVALVSGHRATGVTVGADGKCCVVDFTQPTRKKAVLLKSWHLRRPATSLSVVYHRAPPYHLRLDGVAEREHPAHKDYCIAVGRQDGKVLLFDLSGKPLGKQTLDPKGALIVDVEWAKQEVHATHTQTNPSIPESWKIVPRRTSLKPGSTKKRSSEDENRAVQRENSMSSQNPHSDFQKPPPTVTSATNEAFNHFLGTQVDLHHAAGPKVQNRVDTPKATSKHLYESDGFSSTPDTSISSTSILLDFSDAPPPIPPRPTPKPGGKLSQRRSVAAREPRPQPDDIYTHMSANDRRKTTNDSTPTKIPMKKASPDKGALFGPRSLPHPQGERWKQRPKDRPNYVFPSATYDIPRRLNFQARSDGSSLSTSVDIVNRDEHPSAPECSSSKIPPWPNLQGQSLGRSPTASVRSYKTASSQVGLSETSTDTVVDWSVVSASHRLEPSTCEPSPNPKTSELSSFRSPPPRTVPQEAKRKANGKGHRSIDASTQTSSSAWSFSSRLSQNSAVAEAIIHWPTLKKSPRIADISAGVESATASVLDLGGYADPTPLKSAQHEATNTLLDNPQRHSSFSSSRQARYIPPRLPLKVSPSTATMKANNSSTNIMHTCPCEPHLQRLIATAMNDFRVELTQGFELQRQWMEMLVRRGESSELRVEEENRLLRWELSRVEKERGKRRVG